MASRVRVNDPSNNSTYTVNTCRRWNSCRSAIYLQQTLASALMSIRLAQNFLQKLPLPANSAALVPRSAYNVFRKKKSPAANIESNV